MSEFVVSQGLDIEKGTRQTRATGGRNLSYLDIKPYCELQNFKKIKVQVNRTLKRSDIFPNRPKLNNSRQPKMFSAQANKLLRFSI